MGNFICHFIPIEYKFNLIVMICCMILFDKTSNHVYYGNLCSELIMQDNIQLHFMRRRLLLAVDH